VHIALSIELITLTCEHIAQSFNNQNQTILGKPTNSTKYPKNIEKTTNTKRIQKNTPKVLKKQKKQLFQYSWDSIPHMNTNKNLRKTNKYQNIPKKY